MITMADSIIPGNLPGGYPAYLVYADGLWKTEAAVRARFPHARLLTMTVLGGGERADGCDRESGDLDAAGAAEWLHLAIIAGQWRPVLYASRDSVPPVLDLLGDAHVTRAQIRILTAHYGQGEHICSPAACDATFTADGTQFTNSAAGLNGSVIDLSVLSDDFFGDTVTPIPLDLIGPYVDPDTRTLYMTGLDADGVLCEVKRIDPAKGEWSAPYPIAGKTGA